MNLRIHDVAIQAIEALRPVVERVERRDRDLARQMRRAASSVALNIAEGANARGGNRDLRLSSALGSAHETLSALRVAVAWRYVDARDGAVAQEHLEHCAAALYRLLHRARR